MAITAPVRGTYISGAASSTHTLTHTGGAPSNGQYNSLTGKPVLYACGIKGSGTLAPPSVTGGGFTWVLRIVAAPGVARTPYAFEAVSGTADNSNIVITFAENAECLAAIVDWQGVHATSPFGRWWRQGSGANGTSLLIPHMAVEDADNAVMAVLMFGGGATGASASWDEGTELFDLNGAVPDFSAAWRIGGFTDGHADASWSGSLSNFSIVHEVREASSTPAENDAIDATDEANVEVIAQVVQDAGGSFTTTSITPAAGEVIGVLIGWHSLSTMANPTTVRDNQGSPVDIPLVTGASVDPGALHRGRVYAKRYASSPGAITITLTFPGGGSSPGGSVIYLFRVRNPQGSSDSDWFGAVDTDQAAAATQLTGLDLGSIPASSGVLAILVADDDVEDMVPPVGFVGLDDGDSAAGNRPGFGFTDADSALAVGAWWCGGNQDPSPVLGVSGSARDLGGVLIEVLGTPVETEIEATLAGVLPELVGDLSGEVAAEGAVGGVLPELVGAVAGEVAVEGSVGGTLPVLSGAITADVAAEATLAGVLPVLTGDIAGTAPTGVTAMLAGVLPVLSGDLDTQAVVEATLGGILPVLAGGLAAEVLVEGTLAGVLPALSGELSGEPVVHGVLTGTLPVLAGAIDGDTDVEATLSGVLPALEGDISGTTIEGVIAAVSGVLPALSGDLDGEVPIDAVIAGELPGLVGALETEAPVGAELGGVLPALVGDVAAVTLIQGELGGLLPGLVGQLDLDAELRALLAGTLPALVGALAGDVGAEVALSEGDSSIVLGLEGDAALAPALGG